MNDKINISSEEIHIWYVDYKNFNDSSLLEACYEILSEKEKSQYDQFSVPHVRLEYLITRAMVRSVLSRYITNFPIADITFSKNKYGKPFISDNILAKNLSFNISHTKNISVIAITAGTDIGIDIEKNRKNFDFLEIAKNSFSMSEFNSLKNLNSYKQGTRFFEIWTLKEAYIKARGKGLHIPLNLLSYSFPEHGKISVKLDRDLNDSIKNWHFWSLKIKNHYDYSIGLVAKKQNKTRVQRIFTWEINQMFQCRNSDFKVIRQSQ